MSGNICAATNSPSPCSKATTISSTNPAPHGTSSPTIPNASPQSHPELGRRSILEAVGMNSSESRFLFLRRPTSPLLRCFVPRLCSLYKQFWRIAREFTEPTTQTPFQEGRLARKSAVRWSKSGSSQRTTAEKSGLDFPTKTYTLLPIHRVKENWQYLTITIG